MAEVDIPCSSVRVRVRVIYSVVEVGAVPDYVQFSCVAGCAPGEDGRLGGCVVDLVGSGPVLSEGP